MKILKPLFFLLLASNAFAQTYHPFIQSGTYRDEFWAPELQFCVFSFGNRFWFRGDSTIGNVTYNKLLSASIQGDPLTPFCPPYSVDTSNFYLFALMREDTAARRVYRYDDNTGTEYLLYDFSVQAGDSVTVGINPKTCYVQEITQETWADGSLHRNFLIITPENGQTTWIESFGNINHIWAPLAGQCLCPHGYCYEKNGEDLFGVVCAEAVFTNEPLRRGTDWQLSPNPASHLIALQSEDGAGDFDRLTLHDAAGKRVAEYHYGSACNTAELSVAHLPEGLYTVLIRKNGILQGLKRFRKT